MTRGVVLWPDERTAGVVRELWSGLSDQGLPSLETHTHRRHQPHCSLSVAEELPADEALDAVGVVPARPIPLLIESVGVFPPNGALVLACVVNRALLDEQARVHHALASVLVRPLPHFEAGTWVPHVTLSMGLTSEQLARAIPLVLDRLPITGTLDHGGVEDGTTGEHWPAPPPGRDAQPGS
jgi:hypothetical protein